MLLTRFLLPYFILMNVVLFLEINLVLIYKKKILPSISYSNWGRLVRSVSLLVVAMMVFFTLSAAMVIWPEEPWLFFIQDLTVIMVFIFQLAMFRVLRRYLRA